MSILKEIYEYKIDFVNKQKKLYNQSDILNKLKDIDISKHSIIVSSHPSPLSFKKKLGNYECFDGSKPFSKINSYLQKMNKKTINW